MIFLRSLEAKRRYEEVCVCVEEQMSLSKSIILWSFAGVAHRVRPNNKGVDLPVQSAAFASQIKSMRVRFLQYTATFTSGVFLLLLNVLRTVTDDTHDRMTQIFILISNDESSKSM